MKKYVEYVTADILDIEYSVNTLVRKLHFVRKKVLNLPERTDTFSDHEKLVELFFEYQVSLKHKGEYYIAKSNDGRFRVDSSDKYKAMLALLIYVIGYDVFDEYR